MYNDIEFINLNIEFKLKIFKEKLESGKTIETNNRILKFILIYIYTDMKK